MMIQATVLALAATLQTQLVAQIQARLDAIAVGDKAVWARDLDESAVPRQSHAAAEGIDRKVARDSPALHAHG